MTEIKRGSEGRWLLITALVLWVFLLAVASVHVSRTVRQRAADIAGGRPYCIVAANVFQGRQRVASGLMDTLGGIMFGLGGRSHAILIVGYSEYPERFHWSYFANDFEPGVRGPIDAWCEHWKFDYAKLSPRDYEERVSFKVHGVDYRVPLAYQPRHDEDGFYIHARYPEFVATKQETWDTISMAFGTKYLRADMAQRIAAGAPTLEGATEITGPLASAKSMSDYAAMAPSGILFSRDGNGQVRTFIRCMWSPIAGCAHVFQRDGMSYSIGYHSTDIGSWREREEAVVRLINSLQDGGNWTAPGS
ncbi:hypothetical protein [Ralstonia chuxiongensis]|uniref:Uncharacterized protein n=1 Tax=Ralstonia chuxiongensis TaxID=2957504 RepID=A0AA42BLW1_9RALS|nr:hypothetical protein [Ralstonia chuxiongensis]MCP1174332.1 hypothetical protein [Ralstonia chuxiongensis]